MMEMAEWNCIEFLEEQIEKIRKRGLENCDYLLAMDKLPHMEPRLRQIHLEAYLMTLLGFPNISIIMQGVLLEALVKEIIYDKEKKDFRGSYGSAINHCRDKGYITEDEFKFLDEFREKIRNIYQHIDVTELTKASYAKVYRIPVNREDPLGSIISGVEEVLIGKAKPPKKMTVDELRPLGAIIKQKIDEETYLIQFLYVDYFVRKTCRKYFPVD